jgi:hypothetical protein
VDHQAVRITRLANLSDVPKVFHVNIKSGAASNRPRWGMRSIRRRPFAINLTMKF